MLNHRRYIFPLIVLLSCLNLYCQPRVNGVRNYSIQSSSQLLNNPVGWCYNNLDKWCGWYNVISSEYSNNSKYPKRLSPSELSGWGDNCIVSLQFKKIVSHNVAYYILYHVFYDGYYTYPAIYEDWNFHKSCEIFVFTEEEYNKVLNLKNGLNRVKIYACRKTSEYYSYLSKDGKEEMEGILKSLFDNPITDSQIEASYNDTLAYNWYIIKEDDKTIRFVLPSYKHLKEDALRINEENKEKYKDRPYLFREIMSYDWIDMSKGYFEVSVNQFNLLKIT